MFESESEKHDKFQNLVVQLLREPAPYKLKYPALDKESIHLRVYSDASYTNNPDGFSQFGYIFFMAHKKINANH